ncbi:MAG TPA: MFS transporter [Bryobacteraceae bacterium]|nr:MFS transporter [Bryobacteraceae bacterium]
MSTKTEPAATLQGGGSQLITNPWLGIAGVFLGAGIATLNARLLSVGLPDLRGALGLGFDESSWLPTALNMAIMFSGCFVVFLSAWFGPRRILLPCAAIFTAASALLPLAPGYGAMLALIVAAGITSGTFYSLTMTFVLTSLPKRLIIFGVGAYAADIVFVTNIASLIEGWYIEHLSWHWIFWTAAVVTPLMMVLVYFGIPRRPPKDTNLSWRGFAYFSLGLALVYGALDQGERLDWLNSGVIVAMLAGGVFLLLAAMFRRMLLPNPILDLSFVFRRNVVVLALSIFTFRFVMLATVILIPSFLGTIQQYRPLETGRALAWVALPLFAVVWIVAVIINQTHSRVILASGLTTVAAGCWVFAHLDSSWAGNSFETVELLLSCGFAASFIGLVASLVLEGLEVGALTNATAAATYSGFMHFIRLFGGQVGVAFMGHMISAREKFHSNLLGLNVQVGNWVTDERLRALTAGVLPVSAGPDEAHNRAVGILSRQVQAQAYTLAISDGFIVVCWMVVAYLMLMLCLRPAKYSYKDLRKMQ